MENRISWWSWLVLESAIESGCSIFRVESKEAEMRVPDESAVFVQQQVLEVVPYSDCKWPWSHKVGSTSWEQDGEGTGDIALGVEFIDRGPTTGMPRYRRRIHWLVSLSLLYRLSDGLLLCQSVSGAGDERSWKMSIIGVHILVRRCLLVIGSRVKCHRVKASQVPIFGQ